MSLTRQQASPRPRPRPAFAWSEAQTAARAFSSRPDPAHLLAESLALADAAAVILCSALVYLARHGLTMKPLELLVTTLAIVLTFNAMQLFGAYARYAVSGLFEQIGRAAQAFSVVFVLLLLLGYLTKTSDEVSRLWAIGWYISTLLALTGIRLVAHTQVKRWRKGGRLARTVAVVDLGGDGDALARRLREDAADEVYLVGVFQATPASGPRETSGIAELIALSRLFRIDEVLVSVGESVQMHADADTIIRRLGTIPTNVRICPNLPRLTVLPREAGLFFGNATLTVYHRPLGGWSSVAKRIEDVVLASLITLLLLPLMGLIALLIRLDSPGPALFRQQRLGFNNNVITVFKFRSMFHRAKPETEVPQAKRRDPRVTRIGGLLRRSSLDELPQLFNVLRGEMSLVGPRPHAIAHNEQYALLIDDYLGRHRVQPGITGLAQINGFRGETDTLNKMQRRVEHDLAYIDNWSILLDLKILFLTGFLGIFNRNAY